jgi:hypothetical protein
MDPAPFDLCEHRGQVGFGGGDLPGELTGPVDQLLVSHPRDLFQERRRHSTTLLGDHTGRRRKRGEHVFDDTETDLPAQAENSRNH